MRTIRRSQIVPRELRGAAATRRHNSLLAYLQLDAAIRSQKRAPLMGFKDDDILKQLVAAFSQKCAFCEGYAERHHVHRFCPVANAEPRYGGDAHIYYYWLGEAIRRLILIAAQTPIWCASCDWLNWRERLSCLIRSPTSTSTCVITFARLDDVRSGFRIESVVHMTRCKQIH